MRSDHGPALRILHVCVHNLCRSVLAERLTRQGLDRRELAGHFDVVSAGTHARPGMPMHPFAGMALERRRADRDDFVTRRLQQSLIHQADLVLTASARERDIVIAMVPSAICTTYTLSEFGRLIRHMAEGCDTSEPIARARQIIADLPSMRGRVPYVPPAQDDIPDPIATVAAFDACAARISWTVEIALDVLCPAAN